MEPRIVDFPGFSISGQAIVLDIDVKHGRFKDKTVTLALSFQEDAYPEYPPHFVHFKSSISTPIATRHSTHDFEGENWSAYSLPPSDFWDGLKSSEKNMRTYYQRHLLRVLARL
ncbi:MAG: hypothetical protein F4X22_13775 [Gemmatimonadales bacterium]|nr:hypothetical protein [Gemmatimonadota bacterium]MYC89285.1 hypothetical protein [Candidatus Palauibacter denitrificans]